MTLISICVSCCTDEKNRGTCPIALIMQSSSLIERNISLSVEDKYFATHEYIPNIYYIHSQSTELIPKKSLSDKTAENWIWPKIVISQFTSLN